MAAWLRRLWRLLEGVDEGWTFVMGVLCDARAPAKSLMPTHGVLPRSSLLSTTLQQPIIKVLQQ